MVLLTFVLYLDRFDLWEVLTLQKHDGSMSDGLICS